MTLHEIHDTSNSNVLELLISEYSKISDENVIKNYHPDYKTLDQNIFCILERNNRYREGKGSYYVLEDHGEFVCASGWNEYEHDESIALLMTRSYISKKYRAQYIIGEHLLPKMISSSDKYASRFITFNEYNRGLYDWFVRNEHGKSTVLSGRWPKTYKNFSPVGLKNIYFTDQYVVKYNGDNDDRAR